MELDISKYMERYDDLRIDGAEARNRVEYTDASIPQAIREHSAYYLYYADKAKRLAVSVSKEKHWVEFMESVVAQEIRAEASQEGAKMTEGAIRERVVLDPRVVRRKLILAEVAALEASADAAMNAFVHRRNMLDKSAMVYIKEMDSGEMRVMSDSSAARMRARMRDEFLQEQAEKNLE